MKRIFCMLLAGIIFCAVFCGCGSDTYSNADNDYSYNNDDNDESKTCGNFTYNNAMSCICNDYG